ncbi:4313_t:CDS:2 [Entrophospora sp. SA101]|nr:4313_t:CDS:2 [Entrophospora sp. SA101]
MIKTSSLYLLPRFKYESEDVNIGKFVPLLLVGLIGYIDLLMNLKFWPPNVNKLTYRSILLNLDTNFMNNSITKTWTQHLSSSSSIVESNSRQDASVETATTSPVSLQSNALNSQNKQGEHADENGIKRKKSKYTKESKKKVKLVTEFKTSLPNARLSDLGGIDSCIEEVLELIAMPLAHPEIYLHTGVQPPRVE